MKKMLIISMLLMIMLPYGIFAQNKTASFRVGAAKVDVTPPLSGSTLEFARAQLPPEISGQEKAR